MTKEEAIAKINERFADPKSIIKMLQSDITATMGKQILTRAFGEIEANELLNAVKKANADKVIDQSMVDFAEKEKKKLIKKMKDFLESEAFCEDGNYVSTYFKSKKELIKAFNKSLKA